MPPSLPSSVVIVCDVLVQKSLPLSDTRFVFCQCWFILAILFSLEGMVDQPRKAVNNLNPYTSSWLFFAVSWCQAIVTVLCTFRWWVVVSYWLQFTVTLHLAFQHQHSLMLHLQHLHSVVFLSHLQHFHSVVFLSSMGLFGRASLRGFSGGARAALALPK